MPTWGELLRELEKLKREAARKQAAAATPQRPAAPSPHDRMRRKYLKKLSGYTGRATVFYGTCWLENKSVPNVEALSLTLGAGEEATSSNLLIGSSRPFRRRGTQRGFILNGVDRYLGRRASCGDYSPRHGLLLRRSILGLARRRMGQLAQVGDPTKYPTKARFAMANGTAPLQASSGRVVRHRLNRGGNRRLNRAIHIAAVTQIRRPGTEGRLYYEQLQARGKTKREALRILKRRISDRIWTHLQQLSTLSTAPT